jgi:hypothetical protein
VTYDHIPQHEHKVKADYYYKRMDALNQHGQELESKTLVITESAWPTGPAAVDLLATSTASPGTIAVPVTA